MYCNFSVQLGSVDQICMMNNLTIFKGKQNSTKHNTAVLNCKVIFLKTNGYL